jgi:hypothetical protein
MIVTHSSETPCVTVVVVNKRRENKILIGCGFATVTKKKHLVWERRVFLFYSDTMLILPIFFFNRFAGMFPPFIVLGCVLPQTSLIRMKNSSN